MAGESPDRSRQRESSEQPTPGSAGPVPEARSEAQPDASAARTPAREREKVDPRLAVARDAAPPSGAPRGGLDTATKVFSVRGTAADDGRGDDGRGDGDRDRDGLGDGDGPARADAGDGGGADAGPGAGPEAGEGPGEAGEGALRASEAPRAPEGARKGADGGEGAPVTAPAADGPAGAGAEAGSGGDADSRTDSGADAESGTGADSRADEGGEPEDDVPAGSATDRTADADDAGRTAGTADTADTADADEPEDAAASGGADPEDAKPEDAKPRTAEPDGASGGGGAGGSGSGDGGSGGAAPRADRATAAFQAVRPAVDQPTTMLKLGDAATAGTGEDDAPGPEAEPAAATAPTAKASPVPPPGARESGTDKTDRTDETGRTGGAEAAAERTSRFVALRPLDEPRVPADVTRPVPQLGPERTTQQPLPPKPPLDLLAELTNTPPPPETPLRTLVRRVKIWTPLVLLLVIVFAVAQSMRPLPEPTLDLTAQDGYTFGGGKVDIPWPEQGQAALDVQGIGSFGSSGTQKPVPIASVAKVMTAYLILRDHPVKSGSEGPEIKIDQAAEDQSDAGQESTVPLTAGDAITEREALESILIASANNVARLLARWDAGSEEAFVAKMNAAAEKLGMDDTTYTDPSGLNNTTVSTAVDQVKLAKAAMKQPVFREVAAMMSYVDYKGARHNNWNQLVGFNNVVGIKTGTTTSALGNLVFAAKKEIDGETRTVVGAVVRQPAGGSDNTILQGALSAGDRLIRAAQDALESATILKKGSVVGYADDGLGGRTPVVVTQDVKAVGWAGLSVRLTFAGQDLPHTAKAGTKVGTLTVGDGTSGAVKVPVALQEDLVEPGFADRLTRIL